jgi:hypothetical protein
MKYEIIDNFLPTEEFIKIKNLMLGSDFPWYYNNGVSHEQDSFYFTHKFFDNHCIASGQFDLLYPVFKKLNLKFLMRVKGNFYPKTLEIKEHGKHVDYKFSHNGFILYINTNNGFTRLKDGSKIESYENRGLLFDASIEHNSSTCTDQNGRININFNYF